MPSTESRCTRCSRSSARPSAAISNFFARLSAALFDAGFKAAVGRRRRSGDEILAEARRVEAALAHKHEAQGRGGSLSGGSDGE